MKDQLQHWNNAHKEQWLHGHSQKQTAFAEEVIKLLPSNSSILELGCGEGNDSVYFAEQGHNVLATDFSDVAIEQNKTRWDNPNLKFSVLDMNKFFGFGDSSFNAVYARLSLHYFPDITTKAIFKEIHRILKPNGMLYFMCKEVKDDIYGRGDEIEKDMYELDGHVRHFFSEQYVNELCNDASLRIEHVETGKEAIYDRYSAFIKVMCKKI